MTKIFNIRFRLDGRVESIAATATGNGKKWQEVILFGCGDERFQYHWTEGPPGEIVSVYASDCGKYYCDARVVRMAITGWLNYIRVFGKKQSTFVNVCEAYEVFMQLNPYFENHPRVILASYVYERNPIPGNETVSAYVNYCGRYYCDVRVVRMAITGWLNYIRDIRKIRPGLVKLQEPYEDFTKFKENFRNQSRVSLSRTEWDYHMKAGALTAAGFKYENESGQWARPQV